MRITVTLFSLMCRVRRARGTQNTDKWWLSSQIIQETEQKQRRLKCSINLAINPLKDLHTASWNNNKQISFAQGTAAGENPSPINSLMAKTQTTTKPVPRANIPIMYVQYRSCCFLLTAIYGRFALSPIYLSLWIDYLLAAPWVFESQFGILLLYKGKGTLCLEDTLWICPTMQWEICKSKIGS